MRQGFVSCRLASLETRHAGQPIKNRASSPRAVVECEPLEAFSGRRQA